MKYVILLSFLILSLPSSYAQVESQAKQVVSENQQTTKSIKGFWFGVIDAGPIKIRVGMKISPSATDTPSVYSGTLDVIDQNLNDLRIDVLSLQQNNLHFELKGFGASFDGFLTEDEQIKGEWKQAGRSFPLTFKKLDKPFTLNRPQNPQKPYPYKEETVVYENKKAGIKLAGTLTLPDNQGPHPVAIMITGSGPQNRNEELFQHKPFLVIADYLTRRGIAVLRYDDRGVGESTGNFPKATTEDFAEDVLAGIDYLKSRKDIDAKQIGLIGHSEGGIVAPMVATRSSDVAFIVLLAGPGMVGRDLLMLQGELITRAEGTKEETVKKLGAYQKRIYDLILKETDKAATEKAIREEIKKLLESLSEDERKVANISESTLSMQLNMLTSDWFRGLIAYDPSVALKQIKCPVLALNGEKDIQVPAKENLKAIDEALKAGGNKDYKIVTLSGLNHLFQSCETGQIAEYGFIEETFSPKALEEIGNWLDGHVKKLAKQ
ncbi:MAG: alpha/beta fold hydrolase [Blastocatellia bacterium]|nr:alpha/beta fold hydrolase [Blastocatellia bacterium]